MFSVRVSKKKEGGGAFYFLFFIFKMVANGVNPRRRKLVSPSSKTPLANDSKTSVSVIFPSKMLRPYHGFITFFCVRINVHTNTIFLPS